MVYKRIAPEAGLEELIECYWTVESDDSSNIEQKIIPDGFPEIIFHFGSPFMIRMKDKWEIQEKILVAGQITRFFFIRNTNLSSVFGIKLQPAALSLLFNINMIQATDNVQPLVQMDNDLLNSFSKEITTCEVTERINVCNVFLKNLAGNIDPDKAVINNIVKLIFERQGAIDVLEMRQTMFTSERQLQRLFKKHIGVAPKLYARIIRFSHIFELIQEPNFTWSSLSFEAGFYDHSHFIKNFRNFTGEDPGNYTFDELNLANFF